GGAEAGFGEEAGGPLAGDENRIGRCVERGDEAAIFDEREGATAIAVGADGLKLRLRAEGRGEKRRPIRRFGGEAQLAAPAAERRGDGPVFTGEARVFGGDEIAVELHGGGLGMDLR